MTYKLPEEETPARQRARDSLSYAIQVQQDLLRLHTIGFEMLWGPESNRKTVAEMNAIFDEMDSVQVGQSATLFGQAWALAELVIGSGIVSDPAKFLPPYNYTIDGNGHVTVAD